MTLLLKLIAAGVLHLAFFACYPETGPFGNYYLAISLLVWIVFIMFINTSTKLIKLLSGAAGLIVNLAAFVLMGLAIAATMPQSDKTTVIDKLQAGKYPDRDTVNRGMKRFGVHLNKKEAAVVRTLDRELEKTAEKLKERGN